MTWFYTSNGNQSGPVTQQELESKLQSGEVKSTDLIWKEGMADWLPLNQVSEFSSAVVASAPQFGAPMPAQANPYNAGPRPHITNYLWQAIVVTVLCCSPLAIVAIVYAARVDGLVAKGDIEGAKAASRLAKIWVNIGVAPASILLIIAMARVVWNASNGNM